MLEFSWKKKAAVLDIIDLSSEETSFIEFVSRNPNMFVTQIYKALHLSGYKGDKLKESLIEKELIIQEETRKGKRGRLAKILIQVMTMLFLYALMKKASLLLKKRHEKTFLLERGNGFDSISLLR